MLHQCVNSPTVKKDDEKEEGRSDTFQVFAMIAIILIAMVPRWFAWLNGWFIWTKAQSGFFATEVSCINPQPLLLSLRNQVYDVPETLIYLFPEKTLGLEIGHLIRT